MNFRQNDNKLFLSIWKTIKMPNTDCIESDRFSNDGKRNEARVSFYLFRTILIRFFQKNILLCDIWLSFRFLRNFKHLFIISRYVRTKFLFFHIFFPNFFDECVRSVITYQQNQKKQ